MSHLTICLIICVLTMISYVIGKLPMGLTAMLSMVAFVITGCLKQETALSYFGNANGVMMLSMCMASGGYDIKSLIRQSLLPASILCLVAVFWIMTVFPLYV